ncbi:hypothetical protein FWG76_02305 [Candidatus Saccharibacteria bacterium]|nr:hypothetical protein [Candidatus Saccharibacteria bacterium]
MNNNLAIAWGGLAARSQFFGSATAETTSVALDNTRGSWSGDWSRSVSSELSWFRYGGRPVDTTGNGVFAYFSNSGALLETISHRTILLGY